MEQELELGIIDKSGTARRVHVHSTRFVIGRSQENDLVIDEPGLSRQHALIEIMGEKVILTDRGSQNGTFVNGRRIDGSMAIEEGDVISLGVYDIKVHRSRRLSQPAADLVLPTERQAEPADGGLAITPPFRFGIPVMAAIAGGLIVVAAVVLMALVNHNKPKPIPSPSPDPSVSVFPSPTTSVEPCADVALDQIERDAKQFMRVVSDDKQELAFPPREEPRQDIQAEVRSYCGRFFLGEAIKRLNQNRQRLHGEVEKQGLKLPGVLAAALAETSGGRNGDPVSIALQMIPGLARRRVTFGDNTADSMLIAIAAYPEGYDSKGRHPLVARIRESVQGDLGQRNVWDLRQKALTAKQYEFVVRFLAMGIIGRNPKQYGIDTPRLDF